MKVKRVTMKEEKMENEKYEFRCFLLRLRFIRDEYKVARKVLLRHLSGNSAWKVVETADLWDLKGRT